MKFIYGLCIGFRNRIDMPERDHENEWYGLSFHERDYATSQ